MGDRMSYDEQCTWCYGTGKEDCSYCFGTGEVDTMKIVAIAMELEK